MSAEQVIFQHDKVDLLRQATGSDERTVVRGAHDDFKSSEGRGQTGYDKVNLVSRVPDSSIDGGDSRQVPVNSQPYFDNLRCTQTPNMFRKPFMSQKLQTLT